MFEYIHPYLYFTTSNNLFYNILVIKSKISKSLLCLDSALKPMKSHGVMKYQGNQLLPATSVMEATGIEVWLHLDWFAGFCVLLDILWDIGNGVGSIHTKEQGTTAFSFVDDSNSCPPVSSSRQQSHCCLMAWWKSLLRK